ncbi:hypothetical protein DAEQUDRAFT_769185 [Daedalea quercina L-15889]|uniref:DNA 3'-5' helicase n=1 Tax=Daedalea quercina L-15889 TaxID=1314783 RepID=A0A165LZ13_9APHY|nr:hypothetical protein DAEQUDRAFT_769185 [Daedalea quercina L-15889]
MSGSLCLIDTLEIARDAAHEARGYDPQAARARISEELKNVVDETELSDWHVDMTEAIMLGLDCVLTGLDTGVDGLVRVRQFAMPLLVDETKRKMVVIITPQGGLKNYQVNLVFEFMAAEVTRYVQSQQIRDMGLSLITVRDEKYTKEVHEEIRERKHRVIVTGPWMALEHKQFSRLLRSPAFTKDVAAIVVDEAHCVSEWINSFRRQYSRLSQLRDIVPLGVPFVAASPAIPPMILMDVRQRLGFSTRSTFLVNLGNDRANVTPLVVRMAGDARAGDLAALHFTVQEALAGGDLVKTIIFFNNCELALRGWRHLRELLPDALKERVDFLYTLRGDYTKRVVAQRFLDGEISILCATEAAMTGLDVASVRRVVQYMLPVSLFRWAQRYSHAGRDGKPAVAVFLAEESALKNARACVVARDTVDDTEGIDELNSLFSDESDDASSDDDSIRRQRKAARKQKQVEEGLLDWLETTECRRAVANRYFDNPVRSQDPIVPCCDVCLRRKADDPEAHLSSDEQAILEFHQRARTREPGPVVPPAELTKDNAPAPRQEERAKCLRDAILEWRWGCWEQHCGYCVWEPRALLSENAINKLVHSGKIETMEQLRAAMPDWGFFEQHGADLLTVITREDQEWQ